MTSALLIQLHITGDEGVGITNLRFQSGDRGEPTFISWRQCFLRGQGRKSIKNISQIIRHLSRGYFFTSESSSIEPTTDLESGFSEIGSKNG